MRNDKDNLIVRKSTVFSIKILDYCEELIACKKFILAKQLLRSGTGIGASIREAQNSESLNDFIHKMKIAAKEASETGYWLLLCECSNHYPYRPELGQDLQEIIRILSRIIGTSKRRNRDL